MAIKARQILTAALKVGLAAGLITWLISSGVLRLEELAVIAQPSTLTIGMALTLTAILLNIWRWHGLLRSKDIAIPFSQSFSLSFIGLFFNYALPGGVGGDVVKGYYLMQIHPDSKLTSAMTILVDRILGVFSLLTLALIAMIFGHRILSAESFFWPVATFVVTAWSVLVLIAVVAFTGGAERIKVQLMRFLPWKDTHFLFRLMDVVAAYRHSKACIGKAVLIGLFSQLTFVLVIYFVSIQLGVDLDFFVFLCLAPLGTLTTVLPIAPAGVGVGQAGIYFFFKPYGEQAAQAAVVGITAVQVFTFISSLIGALLYLTRKKPEALEVNS